MWGSTYLAIRWVVEAHWPLLSTAAVRFLLAAVVFLGVARWQGPLTARGRTLANASVAGVLLFVVSNALVMWAETRVNSGLAALLVALTPVWITAIEAALGARPSGRQVAGVAVGLVGVGVLADPRGGTVDPLGALALLAASGSWALGTVWSKRAALPASTLESAGWQMAAASVVLLGLAALKGEPLGAPWDPRAFGAFLWLLVGGSVVGFGTFAWLLRHTRPAVATTYAYVNPLVAAFLGWRLAGEAVTVRTGVASVLILGGVAAITTSTARQERRTTL